LSVLCPSIFIFEVDYLLLLLLLLLFHTLHQQQLINRTPLIREAVKVRVEEGDLYCDQVVDFFSLSNLKHYEDLRKFLRAGMGEI